MVDIWDSGQTARQSRPPKLRGWPYRCTFRCPERHAWIEHLTQIHFNM